MSDELSDVPVLRLRGDEDGSTEWEGYWRFGQALDELFPGQDADEFASGCANNAWGPAGDHGIVGILMAEQGDRDGPDWVWLVQLDNGETYFYAGGCDYTGWDCQSDMRWELAE